MRVKISVFLLLWLKSAIQKVNNMADQHGQDKIYAIGADIGGTHITSAVVNLAEKSILSGSVFHQKVNAGDWPSAVIPVWAATLKKSIAQVPDGQLAGVGLAMPGPFDYDNGVSQITGLTKYERLFGLNVKHALSEELNLEMDAVRLMNDANSFLFGESWLTEKNYQRIIGITLGTGFGAAFFKDGCIVEAGQGVPPNAEFFPLPFRGATSEDYISSRGILKAYHAKTGNRVEGVREVADLAAQGDAAALAVMAEFGETLGAFLGNWLNDFGAEALIIGGNISRAHAFFIPTFEKVLQSQGLEVDVIISQLLDQAGILGAGRLFASDASLKRPNLLNAEKTKFSLNDGQEIGNLRALTDWMPANGKIVFNGLPDLPWTEIKQLLITSLKSKNIKSLIYETSPRAVGNVPGYALSKIKADPIAQLCILLGPDASQVGWEGILVQVH